MTTAAFVHGAYKTTTKATATPRGIEYQVLARINAALEAAENKKQDNHPVYIRALSDNLKFWTIVGSDVASDQNQLPQELRAQLFYLFEYTRSVTNKIIGGEKSLTAHSLIDINKNIMVGLKGTTSEQVA